MSNESEDFVMSKYPNAKCLIDEPCHKKDIVYSMIAVNDNGIIKILGYSHFSV